MMHVEHLLAIWTEDCNQKRIPLDKAAIQAKARNLFSAVQARIGEVDSGVNFLASNGEAASADSKAAAQFPATLRGIIEEGSYTDRQIFNVDETRYSGRECQPEITSLLTKELNLVTALAKNGLRYYSEETHKETSN
uniref:HTH CENPB-type domain-containing protein n=1 Tax=Trichuris muris TaxID=70415 RepID=A0A5S6QAC9_TRIMR